MNEPVVDKINTITTFEASVTVDITDLKVDQFTPGMASAKPKITFDMTDLDNTITLDVPGTLKTSSLNKNTSEYIKQEAAIGYIYMLDNNVEKERAWDSLNSLMGDKKASEYVTKNADLNKLSLDDIETLGKHRPKKIEPDRLKILGDIISALTTGSKAAKLDPEQYTKAVKLFNALEPNKNIRKGFAEQKLDEYLSAQTSSTLGDKELNYIKNGIVSIMKPLCSLYAEADALEVNAEKIIRQCATDKGKKISFSQKWQKFKDNVSDIAGWLIGRENKAKTVMKENAGIVTKISKHLSSEKSTKTNLPPKTKVIGNERSR